MTSIVKAVEKDFQLFSEIAILTFIESHGRSANEEDIHIYVTEKYSEDIFKEELSEAKNIYHIIYYDNNPAGYSKIIFTVPYPDSKIKEPGKAGTALFIKGVLQSEIRFSTFSL